MQNEPTSKSIDGITDLVVVAPIKDGFINAYENITYATRLRLVAEALNRVRVTAREYEKLTPFSDVTERILTLLDFRIGVLDKDFFSLDSTGRAEERDAGPQARRYLYLTATFDGSWEPYMRLIWKPLGPFLDLLFCNCEDYVTAGDHGFDEYAQWVRDNQIDSAIFYSTTGLTVRDHLYLGRLEQIQRAHPAAEADRRIARLTMPDPEQAAVAERQKASDDAAQYAAIHRLALEALTVLYRLADYYPPEWLTGQPGGYIDPDGRPLRLEEGKYLARAARDLLLGWQALIPREGHPAYANWQAAVLPIYGEPLRWFETGIKHLADIEARRERRRRKDPPFDPAEVQSGILTAQGSRDTPMTGGALLLMTIADAAAARTFLAGLRLDYEGTAPADDFFRTLGFTADGLRRIGLETAVLDRFPKEFREGMAQRSGLLGDMRENHPRNWTLPRRNWPPIADGKSPGLPRPPVELSEVDIVIQIRTAHGDPAAIHAEIARLADRGAPGLQLLAYEMLATRYAENGALIDHFGLLDGISQPRPARGPAEGPHDRDRVRLGEIVTGYANDRGDAAPGRYASDTGAYRWRAKRRKTAQRLQFNGSYLAIRKLEQRTETFEAFIAAETARINRDHPTLARPMTAERLKALMIGRYPDGRPLVATADGSLNDFDYAQDTKGEACPFASHVRRANPRDTFLDRPAPRILRRGMSFDQRDEETGEGARGLMFMAYGASLAEQYETVQRWINGGNSSFVASGHNDPLLGIAPKTGTLYPATRTFRFVEQDQVIRVAMPEPFVALHWGLYLFVPSRTALGELTRLLGDYHPMDEALEASGKTVIDRLEMLDDAMQGKEWKRLLEDFGAKDPAERNISPDMWAAIRWYRGGVIKIEGGTPLFHDWNTEPDRKRQPIILAASYRHVMRTLADWRYFTTEEQLRRIEANSGPIYVTQQPDNRYRATVPVRSYHYRKDAEETNGILMAYDEEAGYKAGYAAGRAVLDRAQAGAGALRLYKIELRRQYLLPALGELCRAWYGLPDGIHMYRGGWLWEPPAERTPPGPRCPGDFLSPSRNAFYPRPSDTVAFFADAHGKAVLDAARAFVKAHRPTKGSGTGTIAAAMFRAIPKDDERLARNLIGTMVGAIPPMDGNLRGILLEWLTERTLWRHQAALRRAFGDGRADSEFSLARDVLFRPISQAMCKRPAPDLLYRTVTNPDSHPVFFKARDKEVENRIAANERDLVVASLVSASQESLRPKRGPDGTLKTPDGDVSIVFGGRRRGPYDPRIRNINNPVHACPAREMALGAIMGIMAALLDAGRIQALPASLIVRISDW
jgi:Dyp-type peroxidase family